MTGISIDRGVCFGSGECVLAAPDVFDLDPAGIAVIRADAMELDAASARRIAENCPSGALSVVEGDATEAPPGEVAT